MHVFCLMGPTASGKTGLAIELAQHFPLEIISVDSGLIYRGMDIGTAKPTADELKKAPHYLINILDPAQFYSAGQFCEDAKKLIEEIHQRGNIPFLVGGTMMYFHALQNGIAELPRASIKIRKQIADEAEKFGWAFLHEKLKSIDPKSAEQVHPNDAQRIGRALEVFISSGIPLSKAQQKMPADSNYQFENLILRPERKILHERIAMRMDEMLAQGFVEEVRRLFERGDLHADMPSIRTVGYRQVWAYLKGECNYETMREKAVIATRQLAKRQYTWLQKWQGDFSLSEAKLPSAQLWLNNKINSIK